MVSDTVYRRIGRPVMILGLRSFFGYALIIYIISIMFLTYLAYLFLSLAMTIISAIIALSAGVFILFRLNKKYGENGLPQLIAKEQLPKYIVTTRVKNIL